MFGIGLSSFTVKPLLIACAVLLLALGTMTVLYHGRGSTIDGLQAQLDGVKTERDTAVKNLASAEETNKHQTDVVHTLQKKYADLVGKNEDVAKANALAVAERDAAARARDKANRDLQRLKENLYATDPSCADWGARPVCPAISSQLLHDWDEANVSGHEIRTPGGARSPVRGDRTELAGSTDPGSLAPPGDLQFRTVLGWLFLESAARSDAIGGLESLPSGGG